MKRKYLSLFAVPAIIFTACDTPNYDDLVPSQYNTVLLLKETGEQGVTLYDTGDDGAYAITIFKSGKLRESRSNASIKVLDEAELAEYSARVGKTYTGIPESMYEISQKDFDFDLTERHKKANVIFKTDLIREFIKTNEGKNCVLPVLLYQKTKKDSVNHDKKLVLLAPEVVKPVIQYLENSSIANLTNESVATYNFTLSLPFVSPWDFECEVALPENGVLTSDQMFFENGNKAIFKKGRSVSEPVQVKVAKVGDLVGKKAIVPISVVSSTKSGIQLPDTPFNLEVVYGGEHNKIPLTEDMLYANIPQLQPKDGGGLPALIDNNPNTYFHSRWSPNTGNEPHYIRVSFKQPVSRFAFSYQNRNNSNGKAQNVNILVKVGEEWKNFTAINSGLPVAAGSIYDSYTFKSDSPVSGVAIQVMKTNSGTAPTYFSFAELAVYGK